MCVAALLLVCLQQGSSAQDSQPEVSPPEAPPVGLASVPNGELQISNDNADAGFDAFANVDMLVTAWKHKDSVLVADVALRFAEGERVLMRSHKAISTGLVFDLAIRLATEKRDKETLTRLAKAFEKMGDESHLEEVKLALTVAESTRAADPVLMEGTEEELATIQQFQWAIEASRIDGDREELKRLEGSVAEASVTDKQRAALVKVLQDAGEMQLSDDENAGIEIMQKLGGTSRGIHDAQPDFWGTWRVGANGRWYRENFWFWKDRIYVVDTWKKNWFGQDEPASGHMVYRQSSEYVQYLWNPPTGTRQIAGGYWIYVHPSDLNTVYFWQKNGTWSTNLSLTALMEGGKIKGSQITISLPPNVVPTGSGSIIAAGGPANSPTGMVAAGGGNLLAGQPRNLAGMVAAGGGNIIPRPSSPLLFIPTTSKWSILPK